jgi:hypothetical protein
MEKSLADLLIIAHDHGVPAAMEEWNRRVDAKEAAKAQSSPDHQAATSTSSAATKTTPRPNVQPTNV